MHACVGVDAVGTHSGGAACTTSPGAWLQTLPAPISHLCRARAPDANHGCRGLVHARMHIHVHAWTGGRRRLSPPRAGRHAQRHSRAGLAGGRGLDRGGPPVGSAVPDGLVRVLARLGHRPPRDAPLLAARPRASSPAQSHRHPPARALDLS